MKDWRLTKQAEQTLLDIALWTLENFGEKQAIVYRDALISCINRLANDNPLYGKSYSHLVKSNNQPNNLFYCLEGKHYIIYRTSKHTLDILDFFHERCDLPYHLKKL